MLRTPITLWFIATCPGMAIVRLLRLDEPIAEMMLAVASSLALASLIPAVFLYLGAWSPALSLTSLVAITAMAWAVDAAILGRQRWLSIAVPAIQPIALVLPSPRETLLSPGHRSSRDQKALRIAESTADNASPALRLALDRVIDDIDDQRHRGD